MKSLVLRVFLSLVVASSATSCSKKNDAAPGVGDAPSARESRTAGEPAAGDQQKPTGQPTAVEAVLGALGDAEKTLARDTFDPAAVVQTIGRDPQALLAWTRESTHWVPYRGALRGYVGVLMDRIGNSLDRSLLLAELLKQAGHEVRLASRSLSQAQVAEMLEVVGGNQTHAVRSPARPTPAGNADLRHYSQLLGMDPEELQKRVGRFSERVNGMASEMATRLDVQVPFLARMVGESRATNDWDRRAAAALQDHWWVQLKDGAGWIDLDPLLPASGPSRSLGAAERTFAYSSSEMSIPLESSFVHEVAIRVFIQQSKSGGTTEHKVFEHSLRPAELFGKRVVLEFAPVTWPAGWEGFPEDPLTALGTAAPKMNEWLPMLRVGDRVATQSSFTDRGDVNSSPERRPALGNKPSLGQDATFFDALGGGEAEPAEPENDGQLTAAWVEYEVSVPGEPPNKVTREIFRLAAARGASEGGPGPLSEDERLRRALRLFSTTQILLQACRLSPEYLSREDLADLRINKDALVEVSQSLASGDVARTIRSSAKLQPMGSRLLALASARFGWNRDSRDVYLGEPNVLTRRTNLDLATSGALMVREGFDILTNRVAVHRNPQESAFMARLRQGVADTNAEAVLEPSAAVNAGTTLQKNMARKEDWLLVRSVDDQGSSGTSLPDDARSMLRSELERGYLVVARRQDQTASDSGTDLVWWRIDPKSGDSLGMNRFGGATYTEQLLIQASVGMGSAGILFGICTGFHGGNRATPYAATNCLCAGMAGGLGIGTAAAFGATGVVALPFFALLAFNCLRL